MILIAKEAVPLVEDKDINMGGGWKMTIRMDVDKYGKSFIEIAKVRNDRKIGRFKLNPRYAKELGELLIDYAGEIEAEGGVQDSSQEEE